MRRPGTAPHSIAKRAIQLAAAPWHHILRRDEVPGRMLPSVAPREAAASGRLGTHPA